MKSRLFTPIAFKICSFILLPIFVSLAWGQLDHFTFELIDPPTKDVGVPFSIHVEARDATEGIYTNFNSTIDLHLKWPVSLPYSPTYYPIQLAFVSGICDTSIVMYMAPTSPYDSVQLWTEDPWGLGITGESN